MSFCLSNLEGKKIGLGKKLYPHPIFFSFPFHSNQTIKKSHFSHISQSNIENKVCFSKLKIKNRKRKRKRKEKTREFKGTRK